jgi:hypothetical protein
MLHRYNDFTNTLLLESLLLESKLEVSPKMINLLNTMPDGKIKSAILKLIKDQQDLTLVQNYLDISSNKEEITFIQDRRASQILAEQGEMKWITNETVNERYLTFNKDEQGRYKNRVIFEALGFDASDGEDEHPLPGSGETGVIVSETVSRTSGKTYVLFKWGDGDTIVLNKMALDPHDDRYNKIWSQTRNPIRVGRLFRAILTSAKIEFTDKEMEEFVNQYKSSFDIMNDAFLKFRIVKGDKIAKWYNYRKYESMDSTLGSSCMADVNEDFFDIYCDNEDVCSLVILYGEDGEMEDGKFKGKKIRGRALLWKTDQGDMFMDRIYYNNDSDVDLFKQYAERNGWWCKRGQNSESNFYAVRGSESKSPTYTVTLKNANQDKYPYVDTLTYLNPKTGKLSNKKSPINAKFELDDTDGEYSRVYDEDDD